MYVYIHVYTYIHTYIILINECSQCIQPCTHRDMHTHRAPYTLVHTTHSMQKKEPLTTTPTAVPHAHTHKRIHIAVTS